MTTRVLVGDARDVLKTLPDASVHMACTSPPYYGLRDYGVPGQMGLEATPDEWVQGMVGVFREVRRVLRPDGTLWLNIGDSYAGSGKGPSNGLSAQHANQARNAMQFANGQAPTQWLPIPTGCKPKDLIGIPWMLAFALRADGWYLRADIIWSKPNPMPESVTDRPTKAHEYLFLLSRSRAYYYDADAIREPPSDSSFERWGSDPYTKRRPDGQPTFAQIGGENTCGTNPAGRNKRSVWTVATEAFPESHFATYPTALIEPCIKAGCPEGGTVLDPFFGAGTTGLVADRLNRNCIGIEISETYADMARRRIAGDCPMFSEIA